MDAIESGIVKLPRVPVSDSLPTGDMPMYRDLWTHIGKRMPQKGASKSGVLDPRVLPIELVTALNDRKSAPSRNPFFVFGHALVRPLT